MRQLLLITASLSLIGTAHAGKGGGVDDGTAPVIVNGVKHMSKADMYHIFDGGKQAARAQAEAQGDAYRGPLLRNSGPENQYPLLVPDRLYLCVTHVKGMLATAKQRLNRPLYREEIQRLVDLDTDGSESFCYGQFQGRIKLGVYKDPKAGLGFAIKETKSISLYAPNEPLRSTVVYLNGSGGTFAKHSLTTTR